MKILNPFRRWFRKGHIPLNSRYEGASFSRDRSWLPGLTQSALQDINSGDRLELLRRARYFEKNNPLMQQILDLIETNVVGSGINPTPASSDPDFNADALKYWNDWCKYADLTSRQSMQTLQGIIARAQSVDGEIFCFLTRGETGRPRLQLIESHRVGSGGVARELIKQGYTDADGILLDARGRPAFYVVQNELEVSGVPKGSYSIIPAGQIVHFFEPSRAGQYHGLTLFHSSIVTLHDLDDLQRYEMLAAKDAASRANVVYTENGEIPNGLPTRFAPAATGTTDTITDEKARRTYYEEAFGGKTIALRRGDKWTQGESLRPSAAMREFWEYLTEQVCRSVGISYAAVKNYVNWGGAALRAAVTSDNRFYDVRSRVLTGGFQRIYEYVIGWALANGELGGAPADWRTVRWQQPRRATADIGHESKALLEELAAGIRTERDILGELGQDADEVRTQRTSEVTRRLEDAAAIAAQYKIPLMTAYSLLVAPKGNVPLPPDQVADPSAVSARFAAVQAKASDVLLAFMQAGVLEEVAADAALPTSFVWMPAGAHYISAGTPSGETWQGGVVCDERGARAVQADFETNVRRGQTPWIDFNHNDAEAAGWVKGFSWDPKRGIICNVEWTPAGEKALRGKAYRTFSPAFLVNHETGQVSGLLTGHAAGGLVNAPAFGAAMPALIAARLNGAESVKPASGGTPGNSQTKTAMKELLIKILAALAVLPPADASEEQLVALVAKNITAAKPTEELTKLRQELDALTAKAADADKVRKVEAEKRATSLVQAAIARGALKAEDTALHAKWQKLILADEQNAELLASLPVTGTSQVVVSPGIDAPSNIDVTPRAFEAIRAMMKEKDHRKRGEIYCRNIRKFVAETVHVAEVLAANSFGTVTADLIVLRALDLLKLNFPVINQITTDFSSEAAKQGQTIKTRIISVPTVSTYDNTTGWSSSDATVTDVPVTIGQPVGVQIQLTTTEVAGSNRDLFAEQVEASHYALGKNLVDALYAIITQANFSGAAKRTIKALASFARSDVVDMGTALSKRGVPGIGRTLLLNSDYFGALNKDSTLVSLAALLGAGPSVITKRALPNIADFDVIEASNLPANAFTSTTGTLQGFGFTRDALVMATRVPEDYTRALPGATHGAVSVITNPDTGISVQKVDFVDHILARAYSRIAMSYGVAKGQVASGQCLTET